MFEALKARIRELEAECQRLRKENLSLKAKEAAPSTCAPSVSEADVTHLSASEEKIALFRELFRGRRDVYPVRWDNPDGRSGYAPAYKRKRGSFVPKEDREFLPVTDEAICHHLSGEITMGIYPILLDETCCFLAADFDKRTWKKDCLAFLESCDSLGVPAALECSRSGNGGHIWIFFREAVPASLARKLGALILTHCMAARPELGLDSYDRFFPSQDTLPKGGFGNLIALPLQKHPRSHGGSVFLDRDFVPFPDQWAFLSEVERMPAFDVEDIVSKAASIGDLLGVRRSFDLDGSQLAKPWELKPSEKFCEEPIAGPLPETIRVTCSNLLFVEKANLSASLVNRIIRIAAFHNPEFYQAQAMRFSTFGKPRLIHCAEDFPQHVALPRGCLQDLKTLCETHGIKVSLTDQRYAGAEVDFDFQGELRKDQKKASKAILQHEDGIICAATAFGKTVVAAQLIAARKRSTLVIVHRRQLLDQWKERLMAFLDLSPDMIGQIGGGRKKPTGKIDIAVMQSLNRKGEVNDIVADYGHVIIDECHHVSAFSFEQILRRVKARYVLGLTATPERKDGHHPILFMQCGPIRFRMSPKEQAKLRTLRYKVYPIPTGVRFDPTATSETIHDLYRLILSDPKRDQLIVDGVKEAVASGKSPLVLTERTEHVAALASMIEEFVEHTIVLKGGMGAKQRRAVAEKLEEIGDDEPRVIVATGKYVGEGFDDARLDTLFLAMPISWKGTLQQYAGRLHRMHGAKDEVRIYDFVDDDSPVFASMFRKRLKGYEAMGYEIHDPDQSNLELEAEGG